MDKLKESLLDIWDDTLDFFDDTLNKSLLPTFN